MSTNTYHFIMHWKVQATPEEVYSILDDAEHFPEWWPAVYLDIKKEKSSPKEGVGKVIHLYTKGWLPYTIRWQARRTANNFPNGFSLEAIGDLEGKGQWTFEQEGNTNYCLITYDWQVKAEKPILRYLSFILKPIFSANHHWAMRKGLAATF